MPTDTRKITGFRGEEEAARFLARSGFAIVDRNVRTRAGEIDLVAKEGKTLVFVEVKTRRDDDAAAPEINITATKQRHMMRAAQYWLRAHGEPESAYRFDAVSIVMPEKGEPRIRHIIEAFIPSR